jgi:hypothetical protein
MPEEILYEADKKMEGSLWILNVLSVKSNGTPA